MLYGYRTRMYKSLQEARKCMPNEHGYVRMHGLRNGKYGEKIERELHYEIIFLSKIIIIVHKVSHEI